MTLDARQTAEETRDKAIATVRIAYFKMRAKAEETCLKVRATAWETYDETIATAWETYNETIATIWETYEKATQSEEGG